MDHFDQEENSQSATLENPPSLSAENTAGGGGEGTGSSLPDLEQVDSVQGTLLCFVLFVYIKQYFKAGFSSFLYTLFPEMFMILLLTNSSSVSDPDLHGSVLIYTTGSVSSLIKKTVTNQRKNMKLQKLDNFLTANELYKSIIIL